MGYTPHTIRGELRNVIGAIGDDRGKERLRALESLECVESVTPILQPFKLASREVTRQPTPGDGRTTWRSAAATIVVMAGPCSVESRLQVLDVADAREGGRRRACCAAAPSSRAPRPTRSRGSRTRG